MKKIITLFVLALAAYGIYIFNQDEPLSPYDSARVPAAQTEKTISLGQVIGFEDEHNTYAWLGIPFAKPPLGDLRWRAPRPAEPWGDTLEAVKFNSACLQLWGPLSIEPGEEGDTVGSEDCLYLNLWSPRSSLNANAEPLPVMVWIHGGGNTIGSANTYPAPILAGRNDVVVVTINYRLGLLGWMNHPALSEGEDSADGSGNYATLDMIAALAWVRDNIREFGGDPNNVTIFGESAGGKNVYALMASPFAKGLFHRAIAQSGLVTTTPLWRARNFVDDEQPGLATSSNEWLLHQLTLSGKAADRSDAKTILSTMSGEQIRAFMRARPAPQILDGLTGYAGMYQSAEQIRDGYVLPAESTLEVFKSADKYNRVPLLTGTNRDEMKLFMAQDPAYIDMRFGLFPRIKDLATYNRMTAYPSDTWKAYAVDEVASVLSQHDGQDVFAYRWDWDEGKQSWFVDYKNLIGAGHGLDVTYVFGNFDTGSFLPGLYAEEAISGRDLLSQQMQAYWTEFARSGRPARGANGNLPPWAPWQNGADNLMLLDTQADGGLRMATAPMTINMLKQRLQSDSALSTEKRCTLFAELFLHSNAGSDFWDESEYHSLGCADINPWQTAN